MLQWNPVKTASIGPRKCMAVFASQPKKVAVITRWPYYGEMAEMRGSTVTINSRTKLAHCRLWAVSLFLRAFRSCSKLIVALMLLPYKLLITIIGTHSCQRSLRTTFYQENLFKKLSSGVKILRSFVEVDQNIYNKANKSTSMWHPKVTDFFAL